MLSSGIIDLAIGLTFIFGATAALASVITEMIARFLGLRGAYLLAGLRELVDSAGKSVVLDNAATDIEKTQGIVTGAAGAHTTGDPAAGVQLPSATRVLLSSPMLGSQGVVGTIAAQGLAVEGTKPKVRASGRSKTDPTRFLRTWSRRRKLPSYISARSFATAVMDLVVPNASGQTTMDGIPERIKNMPVAPGPLKNSLQSMAANANGDIDRFRASIENWYDDHMARVSGWYKRRTTLITFIAGGILVLLLNINAITIGRALYSDSATRTAVSAVASQGNPCPASSRDQQSCLAGLEKRVSDAAQAGLPLGWGIVPACTVQNVKCGWLEQHGITTPGDGSWWQVFLAVLGFLATIVALAPGAQFWFGLVVKLNSLRSSGPPPASSAS
ncbi:MAG TPA: hypothetical protein VFQ68_22640 [Streptosporangiaceae bacterium]|nr:hypothetical protein [Streptosporangiaceae bacterium]